MAHGVSIKPVSFLIVKGENVKLLPVEHNCTIDKVLDYMPDLCEKTEKIIDKMMNKKEETEEIKIQKPKVKKVGMNYNYQYETPEKGKNEDE